MTTTCCIVGGGPAGALLPLLLARKGVEVTLLELHKDFDRDFRGDTVHASTLEVLEQIGLADGVLKLPHAKMTHVGMHVEGQEIELVNFARLPSKFPFVAIMPQGDFLNFLNRQAQKFPNYRVLMSAGVNALIHDETGRVSGVEYRKDGASHQLHAHLVFACDGRFSSVRKLSGLKAQPLAPPMDVCWLRLPRKKEDGHEIGGLFMGRGQMLVMLPRPKEWQIGFVLPKGDFKVVRERGLEDFQQAISTMVPWLGDRVALLKDWRDIHLLSVTSDRLEQWQQDGLLLIGDAAHVMSPVGGVGINVAIGDAVAAANILIEPLLSQSVELHHLVEVQTCRQRAMKIIQRMQILNQENMVKRALSDKPFQPPLAVRLLLKIPMLLDIPAKMMALGPDQPRLKNA